MNLKIYTLLGASFLTLLSCNNKQETKDKKLPLVKNATIQNDSVQETEEVSRKESINLFTLTYRDSTDIAFVSLSDIYPTNGEGADKLILPEIEKMGVKAAQYFTLDKNYRNRFLSKTNISETDSLFIYDFSKNKLASFSVKSLNTAALLSGYTSEEEWPYHNYNYMIGFEIKKKYLAGFTDYYDKVLVYVGKENPFTQEQLTPIAWKKTSIKEYPSKTIKKEDLAQLKNKSIGNTYSYKTENYKYFLQEYIKNGEVTARRLLVVDSKTKDIIIEKMFIDNESLSTAPLNDIDNNIILQYTGKLFKHKSPVVFGFADESFGCSSISLIDKSNEDIYLQCDNRH